MLLVASPGSGPPGRRISRRGFPAAPLCQVRRSPRITRLSGFGPFTVAVVGTIGGGGAGASAVATGAGGPSPFRAAVELAGLRRRRRLAVPVVRSGVAGFRAAASATASTTGAGPSTAGLVPALEGVALRLRRLRDVVDVGDAAGSLLVVAVVATAWRVTLAPTSPSAHMVPSARCTSTRQTTIEVGAPPIGGRFWVSVQRA